MSIEERLQSVREELKHSKAIKRALKLPCGHGLYEVTKIADKLITCPVCFKKIILTWSAYSKPKVEWEDKPLPPELVKYVKGVPRL